MKNKKTIAKLILVSVISIQTLMVSQSISNAEATLEKTSSNDSWLLFPSTTPPNKAPESVSPKNEDLISKSIDDKNPEQPKPILYTNGDDYYFIVDSDSAKEKIKDLKIDGKLLNFVTDKSSITDYTTYTTIDNKVFIKKLNHDQTLSFNYGEKAYYFQYSKYTNGLNPIVLIEENGFLSDEPTKEVPDKDSNNENIPLPVPEIEKDYANVYFKFIDTDIVAKIGDLKIDGTSLTKVNSKLTIDTNSKYSIENGKICIRDLKDKQTVTFNFEGKEYTYEYSDSTKSLIPQGDSIKSEDHDDKVQKDDSQVTPDNKEKEKAPVLPEEEKNEKPKKEEETEDDSQKDNPQEDEPRENDEKTPHTKKRAPILKKGDSLLLTFFTFEDGDIASKINNLKLNGKELQKATSKQTVYMPEQYAIEGDSIYLFTIKDGAKITFTYDGDEYEYEYSEKEKALTSTSEEKDSDDSSKEKMPNDDVNKEDSKDDQSTPSEKEDMNDGSEDSDGKEEDENDEEKADEDTSDDSSGEEEEGEDSEEDDEAEDEEDADDSENEEEESSDSEEEEDEEETEEETEEDTEEDSESEKEESEEDNQADEPQEDGEESKDTSSDKEKDENSKDNKEEPKKDGRNSGKVEDKTEDNKKDTSKDSNKKEDIKKEDSKKDQSKKENSKKDQQNSKDKDKKESDKNKSQSKEKNARLHDKLKTALDKYKVAIENLKKYKEKCIQRKKSADYIKKIDDILEHSNGLIKRGNDLLKKLENQSK